jgi:hypothetical protein
MMLVDVDHQKLWLDEIDNLIWRSQTDSTTMDGENIQLHSQR